MMKVSYPVRLALFGLGNRGQRYLSWVAANPSKAVIAAVVDPDPLRRSRACSQCLCAGFADPDAFFSSGTGADAVIIASPDSSHFAIAMAAMSHGMHVFVEKPMATTPAECREMVLAAEHASLVVSVCFELRHHPYIARLKKVLDLPGMGRVVSANHIVNAGLDRSIHNFVRGGWSRLEDAGPVFLSKCSHDVDIMTFLCSQNIRRVHSFGSRSFFREENAPEGSAARCIDCSVEKNCPFSAVGFYQRGNSNWTKYLMARDRETPEQTVLRELREGRFGRCVFRCDNDVADRQTVMLEMSGGAVATIQMNFMTLQDCRTSYFSCEGGEVWGDERTIRYRLFSDGVMHETDCSDIFGKPLHSGADNAIIENFIDTLCGEDSLKGTSAADALQGHLACFAAEK